MTVRSHPLRFQRWAFSDLNPFLSWLAPAAQAVKAQRQALASDHPARQIESAVSQMLSASLDCYRALRDAVAEATFLQVYGNLFAFYLGDEQNPETVAPAVDARELPLVMEALASIDRGGYPETLARVAFLMAHKDEPLRAPWKQRKIAGPSTKPNAASENCSAHRPLPRRTS